MSELELLQSYLKQAVEKIDSEVQGKVAPMVRMKRLLTAKDKRATLLEMAGLSLCWVHALPLPCMSGASTLCLCVVGTFYGAAPDCFCAVTVKYACPDGG